MKTETPLYEMLKKYADMGSARFHMPGHKGRSSLGCEQYDITELSFSDNLYAPQGVIKHAQELMARASGAFKSYMLTGGSSQGVRSMLCAALRGGDKVILSRNCHRSVGDGLALSGALPVYIEPRIKDGRLEQPAAAEVEKCILSNPDAKGILITSPDYCGRCAPLDEIALLARENGMLLMVDEAHGAHFPYYGFRGAAQAGADMWVQSMHKTMGALTQAALLNIKDARFEEELAAVLPMLGTSSPSYLIMASMDLARAELEGVNKKAFLERAADLRGRLAGAGIRLLEGEGQDITRLCVLTAPALSGLKGAEQLEKMGVYPESADQYAIIFILTHKDTQEEWERLYNALTALKPERFVPLADLPSKLPERILLPRDAVFNFKHEYVPVERAVGRVCARAFGAYPPGVPAADCGELIDKGVLDYILDARKNGQELFGLRDGCAFVCLE